MFRSVKIWSGGSQQSDGRGSRCRRFSQNLHGIYPQRFREYGLDLIIACCKLWAGCLTQSPGLRTYASLSSPRQRAAFPDISWMNQNPSRASRLVIGLGRCLMQKFWWSILACSINGLALCVTNPIQLSQNGDLLNILVSSNLLISAKILFQNCSLSLGYIIIFMFSKSTFRIQVLLSFFVQEP